MYQNEEHGVIWHSISPCAPRAYSPNRLAEKTLAPGIWEGSGRGGRRLLPVDTRIKELSGKAGNVPDLERWMKFG